MLLSLTLAIVVTAPAAAGKRLEIEEVSPPVFQTVGPGENQHSPTVQQAAVGNAERSGVPVQTPLTASAKPIPAVVPSVAGGPSATITVATQEEFSSSHIEGGDLLQDASGCDCGGGCESCSSCDSPGCGCGCGWLGSKCHLPCTWHDWWCSPHNMPQHLPSCSHEHGYYYFRPYHDAHVAKQQQAAMRWGEDPRVPYANTLFQRIYADIEAESNSAAGMVEELPIPLPTR